MAATGACSTARLEGRVANEDPPGAAGLVWERSEAVNVLMEGLEGDHHIVGPSPPRIAERERDWGQQLSARGALHAVRGKWAALGIEGGVIVRMVVPRGNYRGTAGSRSSDERAYGRHDQVAFWHAEAPAVRIGGRIAWHEVGLHVDHHQSVVWPNGLARAVHHGRLIAKQSQPLFEEQVFACRYGAAWQAERVATPF